MGGMSPAVEYSGTFTVDDRIAAPMRYLPVEVPAGTSALRGTVSFPGAAGTAVDLGGFAPDGFGGWSGGARESFAVGQQGAAPGYLAGPLTAGEWQVVLGLHLIPA